MDYDFQTLQNRSRAASYKWEGMKQLNPDVADGIVPFSMADMEFPMAPPIVEAVKDYMDHFPLGYSCATAGYLNAVKGWMRDRRGWDLDTDWIVPVPGLLSGIFAIVQALTKPDDGIIYLSPVFAYFRIGPSINGRTPVPCPLHQEGMDYTIDFEALEKLASNPKNTALIFCNPHNPISRIWTREELEKVGDICKRHNVLFISDEVHSDLVMPGENLVSVGSLLPKLGPTILCTGPAKTFNLAGIQGGNLVIPDPGLRAKVVQRLQNNGLFTLTTLAFLCTEVAYTQCGPWLDQCIAHVWENHKALKQFAAERIPKLVVYPMQATYLQWLDFRALEPDPEKLERKLNLEAQVFLDQGYEFGPEGAGFERFNLACPTSVMMEALERLAKVFG